MTVKMISSTYTGTPVVDGKNSLNTMLRAILVNGYNSRTTTQITNITSGTQTMTVTAGHGFVVNQNVTVSNSAYSIYNVEGRVVSVTTTTVTMTNTALTTGQATDTAGGMTIMGSPIGLSIAFSATDKTVFRTANSKWYLRVDDTLDPVWTSTYAKYAKVTLSDGMSDVDNFTGNQCPYQASNPTRNHIGTSSGASAVPGWACWFYNCAGFNQNYQCYNPTSSQTVPWTIIGDGNKFYLIISPVTGTGSTTYFFGEFISYQPGDNYNAALFATNFNGLNASSAYAGFPNNMFTSSAPMFILKPYTGFGDSTLGYTGSLATTSAALLSPSYYSGVGNIAFPNPSNQGLIIHPTYIYDAGGANLRGRLPGAYWNLQNINAIGDRTVFTGLLENPTHQFVNVTMTHLTIGNVNDSNVTFDFSGPWV